MISTRSTPSEKVEYYFAKVFKGEAPTHNEMKDIMSLLMEKEVIQIIKFVHEHSCKCTRTHTHTHKRTHMQARDRVATILRQPRFNHSVCLSTQSFRILTEVLNVTLTISMQRRVCEKRIIFVSILLSSLHCN